MIQSIDGHHMDRQRAIILVAFQLRHQFSVVDFALADTDLERLRPRISKVHVANELQDLVEILSFRIAADIDAWVQRDPESFDIVVVLAAPSAG